MLELANRKNAPTAIKGPRPGELGFHIVLPPMSPQYPTKDLHSPLPIPHMASVPQMGIFGGPIHDHGQSPPRRGQLGSFSIIPTNSIRRKPLHGDLKGQYKYQLPHMGGSMRTIQAQMKPSALRKAKSTLLTRVESMQFREAKENSWKRAQEWGYAWARGDGTQTPQRVGHTGGLTEKQFMQLMDERKKAAIRERARQVAEYEYELRMAGEALDQAQDSQEQASTFSSKRVKFSSDNDEKVAAIGAAAEPMDEDNNEEEDAYDDDCDDDDDDDDDNLDDYNLELQCSSSESEGVGPASAASSVTNDEDHEPEDEQIVEDDETEGDEEIGDEEDDEELGENGIGGESSIEDGSDIDEDTPIPQENVPLPVGLKASENNKGMQAYCKVDDDGSKALAALILTDPVPVDLTIKQCIREPRHGMRSMRISS